MALIETEEQALLRDMLRRYFDDGQQASGPSGATPARADWTALAALGLPGLFLEERWGGSGCGPQELAIAASEMGRSLVSLPYVNGAVVAASLVRALASEDRKAALLPDISAGALLLMFIDGRDGGLACGQGGQLSGVADDVDGGMIADGFVAVASDGDGRDVLLLIDASPDTVVRRATPDSPGGARIAFDAARTEVLASGSPVRAALGEIENIVALCRLADIVGAMDEMLRLTVEHLNTRKQFGRTLAQFQVLQHRAAEMFTELEMARSMLLDLVAHLDANVDMERRGYVAAAAQLRILTALDRIGPEAIQLHGGMGMAWEHRIGHLVRRSMANGLRLGGDGEALDRLAAAPALPTI